mmetsp:Transcript_1139/g.3669  ORF Transcript_1139/g.3669 Transcript_1139/m.3669 type:complete len:547 (+) Transcript_1139:56-1696(+)
MEPDPDVLFNALDRDNDGVLSRAEFAAGIGAAVPVEDRYALPQLLGHVPVVRRTPEWGWLEHLLQASCSTTRLRLRAAWSVGNARLALENEQRCRGLLQLHAWVPTSELPQTQTLEDVCRNGFRLSHKGISFHVGNVKLPTLFHDGRDYGRGRIVRRRGQALPKGKHLYEFLLCRVGVGRAYVVNDAKQAESLGLPQEYDSFFVRHELPAPDGAATEDIPGVLPRHLLHHEYIVRDPAQALPVYVVHFEYDPESIEKLALPVCDNCGIKASMIFCPADHAALCQTCDVKIHSINSIAARHVRMDINRRPGMPPGHCPEHTDADADQYCVECRTPVCPQCRSVGSHSSGDFARHRRIGLAEAYDHVLVSERPKTRYGVPERQEIEQRYVAELDRKLLSVRESGQSVEDWIYSHIQEAVKQGQDLATEQATIFLADELEAKRQLEQSAWLERFLEEKVKALPPPDFLRSWLHHCRVREELAEMGALGRPRDSPALRVEGNLRLRVDESGRRGSAVGTKGAGGKGRSDGRTPVSANAARRMQGTLGYVG